MLGFCDTHRGLFPVTMHASAAESWIKTLGPFIENVDSIRICPNDPKGAERLSYGSTSYLISDYIAAEVEGGVRSINRLKATTRTILFFEGANSIVANSPYEHAHASLWFSELNRQDDLVLWAIEREIQLDRHVTVSHYLYADGHVDVITGDQVRTWAAEFHNFAKPE